MKKNWTAIMLAVAIVLSIPLTVEANCGDLHKFWQAYKNKAGADSANGALMEGWFQGYVTGFQTGGSTIVNWPKKATFEQNLRVLGNYLENHPELWHRHHSVCVWFAFEEAYGLN